MLSCSKCKQTSHSSARFCSWCGSKPGHAVSCVTCWRCGASGHPYAFYCVACGVFLEAPAPPTSCTNVSRPTGGATRHKQTSAPPSHDTTWQPVPYSGTSPGIVLAPPTVDRQTQTVGLFYPSSIELHRKEQQRAVELSRQQHMRDRQPLLTAISPGRGYWRKQLDHVCAHLRSYAQNNTSFRAVLGEPRMGRMVSAVISEDNYEVSLTISFVSAGTEKTQVSTESDSVHPAGGAVQPAGQSESLSSVTERLADSGNPRSDRSADLRKTSKLNMMLETTPGLPLKDSQLLKELGPGQGEISIIQQLLDQGADPSCCGPDGRPALVVAVVNGHHDVIPVLVQRGADINQHSGQMKNTALHEAAALGNKGLQSAQVLLSCNASMRQKDISGQTAYDVALSSGCNAMISLLAARTGHDMLGKLGTLEKLKGLDLF
ncbi:hypothetical protein LDENG_00129020 [Lucifuga dentata]|nr:hypothetical protein LDENG_00129020 [Lucifuga dentata]